MSRANLYKMLLTGASLGALLSAPQAFAQTAAATGEATGLEQVVVTATRQTSTVNRVPLSIAAVTQQGLDQTGIKQAQDISRLVPGLSVPPTGAGGQTAGTSGVGIFTVRGVYSSAGAATTGVYLDDTSLTRRNNAGVFQNNGAPLPILFDLERVEVLKGPQGTLYGGSSQGGTVRFISPSPSLTTYSGNLRLEGKTLKMGDEGYEGGVALGGPLIKDKLGFRVSGMYRRTPGYIDAYQPYGAPSTTNVNSVLGGFGGLQTNQNVAAPGTTLFEKDVDWGTQWVVRGSLLWQVTDRGSVQFSGYSSKDKSHSQIVAPSTVYSKSGNGQLASATETFTTPAGFFDTLTSVRPGRNLGSAAAPLLTPVPYVPYTPALPIGSAPAATPVAPVACSTPARTPLNPATDLPNGIPNNNPACFNRPSYTYGPFPQNKEIAYLTGQQELTGRYTTLGVYSVTLNYDFDTMNVKSITSYVKDHTYSENNGGEDQTQRQVIVGGATNIASGALLVGFPLWNAVPNYPGHFIGDSKRSAIEQEIRFSSKSDARPLSWVAGVFYSNQRVTNHYGYPHPNFNRSLQSFWGLTVEQRYNVSITSAANATELFAHLHDSEIAAYGEANYYITDKLKATAGMRVTKVNFEFDSFDAGPFSSRYVNSVGGFASGKTSNSPTTPKFGLTYEFTPNDLVYINAAKGFRSGGVNAPVGPVVCAPGLALYGITANDAPLTYGPDTVWSYEAGGKFRLLDNKMQLNGAVYRIDWSGIQSAITLTCGQGFVLNGGKARSEGFDFQGQYRPIQPVTLSLNVGYNNAKYIDPVAGPRGAGFGPNAVNAGDKFPVPKWQASVSVNYQTTIAKIDSYLQLDYQWQSGYVQPGSFGVAAYSLFTRSVAGNDVVNARAGARFGNVDVAVFSNNILNGHDKLGNAGIGKTQCVATSRDCSVYNNFNPFVNQLYQRPREIGVQANYRF